MALKDLFKKKPGGTLLGNIVRKVGDTLTGGIVSNLMPRPTEADFDANGDYTKGIFYKPKPGAEGTTAPATRSDVTAVAKPLNVSFSATSGSTSGGATQWLKDNWKMVAGGLAAIGAVLFVIFRRRKSKAKR